MNTPSSILIDQLTIEVHAARTKGLKLWEEKLQLWIRPKPRFVPVWYWRWLIRFLIIQSHTIQSDVFNGTPK